MKLLIDVNLPARWEQYLMEAGFEAVHWSRLGSVSASDDEIIAKAKFGVRRDANKISDLKNFIAGHFSFQAILPHYYPTS